MWSSSWLWHIVNFDPCYGSDAREHFSPIHFYLNVLASSTPSQVNTSSDFQSQGLKESVHEPSLDPPHAHDRKPRLLAFGAGDEPPKMRSITSRTRLKMDEQGMEEIEIPRMPRGGIKCQSTDVCLSIHYLHVIGIG